jgi:hypothetical protein
LKNKHSEPITEAFTQFIAAFLPPKILQADNSREFKGALLILLHKYGIQIINGAPRSPQTQGLVEQANGVVEAKLRAWKMDNGSTQWANRLLEVTFAINTQQHSTISYTPAELLFRERSSYIDWLSHQQRQDPTIRVIQEDSTQPLIYTLSPTPPTQSSSISIGIRISPETRIESEINVRISSPIQSPQVNKWFDINTQDSESEPEPESSTQQNPILIKAQQSTQRARIQMMQKYTR